MPETKLYPKRIEHEIHGPPPRILYRSKNEAVLDYRGGTQVVFVFFRSGPSIVTLYNRPPARGLRCGALSLSALSPAGDCSQLRCLRLISHWPGFILLHANCSGLTHFYPGGRCLMPALSCTAFDEVCESATSHRVGFVKLSQECLVFYRPGGPQCWGRASQNR